jgi:hypothetical protein
MAFGSYGSSTTIGVGSAVLDAASTLRARLNELAADASAEPSSYGQLPAEHGLERRSADGAWAPGGSPQGELDDVSIHTFGAVFAEVRIDEDLCIPRLTRMVGVYSAGRIINPRTARSQMTGGMIWGLGQALLESSGVDLNLGRFISKNLAGYLVPVKADVPEVDASFIEDESTRSPAPSEPKASANSARSVSHPRPPTPSTTPPASGSESYRSAPRCSSAVAERPCPPSTSGENHLSSSERPENLPQSRGKDQPARDLIVEGRIQIVWEDRWHEEEIFANRLSFYLLAQSFLVAAAVTATLSTDSTSRWLPVALTIDLAGLLLTIVFWYGLTENLRRLDVL